MVPGPQLILLTLCGKIYPSPDLTTMVKDYDGRTFVAFLDISGFGRVVRSDIERAASILDKFYGTIYNAPDLTRRMFLTDETDRSNPAVRPAINAIVASDCAVTFPRNTESGENTANDLRCILELVSAVNRELIKPEPGPSIMTTCSIAYGYFHYEDKAESTYLRKNCFFGTPYMNAFSDNEKMKARPGLCRLKRDATIDALHTVNPLLLKRRTYYYYYWMLKNRSHLGSFLRDYAQAKKVRGQAKYDRIKEVLQKYSTA
jgi:hypothetical protein